MWNALPEVNPWYKTSWVLVYQLHSGLPEIKNKHSSKTFHQSEIQPYQTPKSHTNKAVGCEPA